MKSYALLILFLLPGLFAYGQGKTFKYRDKQSHGTVDPRLNNFSIKPAGSIMPSNAFPFSLIRTMAAPVISGKEDQVTHVIRSKGRPVYIERNSSNQRPHRKRGYINSLTIQKDSPAKVISGRHSKFRK